MLEIMKKIRKEFTPYKDYKKIIEQGKNATTDFLTGETLPTPTQKRRYYLVTKEQAENDAGYVIAYVGATIHQYRAINQRI